MRGGEYADFTDCLICPQLATDRDDALGELSGIDALRITCPTCNGDGDIWIGDDTPVGRLVVKPCPDCTDGKMPHERAWMIIAKVIAGPAQPEQSDWSYNDHLLNARP